MDPQFEWLHLDPDTLAERAKAAGWSCEIPHREDTGEYLARLTLRGGR